MSRANRWSWLMILAVGLSGCDKVRAVVCEPVKADAKAKGAGPKAAEAKAPQAEKKGAESEAEAAGESSELLTARAQKNFALPFAWERSPSEPLARARTFLRELADDNSQYMAKGAPFFKAFADHQTPRATVLTCADSRVQAAAFDATPENDDFTVRNIGNQVQTGLGSIQYGVEHLHTPVLLILGHTGCAAVKAALDEHAELEEPIRRELAGIKIEKPKGPLDDRKWAVAVADNVHAQVAAALHEFGARVNSGDLTIVGAIYDFRNDLGKGPGRLAVINVNGNRDPARLKAFLDAIMSTPNPHAKSADDPITRLARALADPGPPDDDSQE